MKCSGCVNTVENILKNSDGVENISVNLLTESAYFEINKNVPNIDPVSYTHLTLPTIYSV